MEEVLDLITGRPAPTDNDDEYVRQAVEAELLNLGYRREQVEVDPQRILPHEGEDLLVRADLLVKVDGRAALIIRTARGSLVSREKEAVAAARLLEDSWLPLAAVANGQEAELLDVATGRVLAQGVKALPTPAELAGLALKLPRRTPTAKESAAAARVYHTFSFIQCPGQCTV